MMSLRCFNHKFRCSAAGLALAGKEEHWPELDRVLGSEHFAQEPSQTAQIEGWDAHGYSAGTSRIRPEICAM